MMLADRSRQVRRIASGGMGTVYEGVDERLGRSRGHQVAQGGIRRGPAVGGAVTSPAEGLLVLVEIDHAGGFGDALLHDLELTLQQRWLPG